MNYYLIYFFTQVSFANRFNCNINGFCRFCIFCLCDADIKLKLTSRKCNKISANYITLKFKNVSLFLRFPDFVDLVRGKLDLQDEQMEINKHAYSYILTFDRRSRKCNMNWIDIWSYKSFGMFPSLAS